MHRVRLAVRENVLSDPNRITESDYLAALDDVGRTWVIEANGEIAAFATGYKIGSIWALFVHPDHEGRGYGKRLHSTVVAWLWSLGHKRIWLTTGPGTRAERFYISQGWQACGTVPGGLNSGVRRHIMHSLLNKIPAHYPRAWVIGVLLWFAGLLIVGVALLCQLTGWRLGYLVALGSLFVIAVCFMGCVAWHTVEAALGRVTPWRRRGDA